MPTIFTHGFFAFAVSKLFRNKVNVTIMTAAIICSMLPDADVIGFRFGIPYESMWGHRGISHSIFFAALLSLIVSTIIYHTLKQKEFSFFKLSLLLFISTVSHPLLDALTNGGMGVALFAPFNNERFFFPFRPIMVSPIGASNFFSSYGLHVMKSEFVFIWIPAILVIAASLFLKRKTS